jgi:hypothetical protein
MVVGAVSWCNLSRSQIFVMVQDIDCGQKSESGLRDNYEFVSVAGAVCKNRDKQLTFIVRVMVSCFVIVIEITPQNS